MKTELLKVLCCPSSGVPPRLEASTSPCADVESVTVVTEDEAHPYPIRDHIPWFEIADTVGCLRSLDAAQLSRIDRYGREIKRESSEPPTRETVVRFFDLKVKPVATETLA